MVPPPRPSELIQRHVLTAVSGRKGPIDRQRDRIANEAHGTIGEAKLQSLRMPAAERVKIGPPLVDVRTAIRLILIGWNGTRAQGAVGIGPGAMGVQQGDIFADEERVAGAVRDSR